jgi:hypothetical protein
LTFILILVADVLVLDEVLRVALSEVEDDEDGRGGDVIDAGVVEFEPLPDGRFGEVRFAFGELAHQHLHNPQ